MGRPEPSATHEEASCHVAKAKSVNLAVSGLGFRVSPPGTTEHVGYHHHV